LGVWAGEAIFFPLDTISTRLKAHKFEKLNPLAFARETLRKERFSLYRGVSLTSLTTFYPSLVYLSLYDIGITRIERYLHKHSNK
jgi:ABC-type polysaccharide/polyol phosphate export permease